MLTHENVMCPFFFFNHIPNITLNKTSIVPQHQLLHLSVLWQHPRACGGNERAKEQAPWVHPRSRGQGASKEGQRIQRPELHTKKGINFEFRWQKSLSGPSRLIKLPCDLKSLLSMGNLEGGRFAYLYSSVKRANLNINCSCHLLRVKVERRRMLIFFMYK